MLAKLMGKRVDHPMAEMKNALALLQDLPKDDAVKSLMELTDWMESVADSSEFKLDYQFALVCLLDETAHTYARKLSRDYFSAHEISQFQENRLWLTLGRWHRSVVRGYYTVFERYCAGDKGASGLKDNMSLLLARTVRAKRNNLRYECVHYGPIDPQLWTTLARLYKYAEKNGHLQSAVRLYPTRIQPTWVQREVMYLLAWYGCGVESLSPLSMYLTERIIDRYIDTVEMQQQPSGTSLFGFDLNAPSIPRRVNVDATVHPYMRFIAMSGMIPKLENLLKVLDKQIVPDDLIPGAKYDPDTIKEAAQYLLNYITALPKRRTVRRLASIKTKVTRGFLNTIACFEVGQEGDPHQTAQWYLGNISMGGFYSLLTQPNRENVRIGDLVGVQPEGVTSWSVAVISRLMRDNENHLHVGAEILSSQIAAVVLEQTDGKGASFEDGQIGLWLTPKVGEEVEGRINLLLSHYVPNCSLQTELHGKKFLLIPVGLKQKIQDCDLIEFRVIERDESEE